MPLLPSGPRIRPKAEQAATGGLAQFGRGAASRIDLASPASQAVASRAAPELAGEASGFASFGQVWNSGEKAQGAEPQPGHLEVWSASEPLPRAEDYAAGRGVASRGRCG